jgi:hypothetical protein
MNASKQAAATRRGRIEFTAAQSGLLRDDVVHRQAHPLIPTQVPQPADRLTIAKREEAAAEGHRSLFYVDGRPP